MCHVYILLCDKKTFYVGITNDLNSRLDEHRNKKSFFTKKFSELEIVYEEKCENKNEAAKMEKQLKGWGRIKKQKLINGLL